SLSDTDTIGITVSPAGISGAPINLGLQSTLSQSVETLNITVTGMPVDWTLNSGMRLGDGSWVVTTNDASTLTVTTSATYTGALVLSITESWTDSNGNTYTNYVADNVEAYAAGSPIFAISGDDNLTASSGNDLLVFSQPIGHDVVYSFDLTHDQI